MPDNRGRYKFGKRSMSHRKNVHPKLLAVVDRVLGYGVMDFSIIDGERTEEEQAANIAKGVSQTKHSKHLIQPDGYAHAVDLLPYPGVVNGVEVWEDVQRFSVLGGMMLATAAEMGVTLRWGGDWDGDGNNADSSLHDMPHFEILLD